MDLHVIGALVSLILLIALSEFSAISFKRLSPFLQGLEKQSSGWEKLSLLLWAFGVSIPLLAFAISCMVYSSGSQQDASNFVLGAIIGSNSIILSIVFSLILLSGPLAFFRIRSINSPIFLLFASVIFTLTCLDGEINHWEGGILLFFACAYFLYLRGFSSEWKYYVRNRPEVPLDSVDNFLSAIAVLCMGFGFLTFAVIAAYPFLKSITIFQQAIEFSSTKFGVHFLALLLSLPWILRTLFTFSESDSSKAITLTSLTHACLLNMLFLPGVLAIFWPLSTSAAILSVDLPVMLFFTGVFASTLLIEKKRSRWLPISMMFFYIIYTGAGIGFK